MCDLNTDKQMLRVWQMETIPKPDTRVSTNFCDVARKRGVD